MSKTFAVCQLCLHTRDVFSQARFSKHSCLFSLENKKKIVILFIFAQYLAKPEEITSGNFNYGKTNSDHCHSSAHQENANKCFSANLKSTIGNLEINLVTVLTPSMQTVYSPKSKQKTVHSHPSTLCTKYIISVEDITIEVRGIFVVRCITIKYFLLRKILRQYSSVRSKWKSGCFR